MIQEVRADRFRYNSCYYVIPIVSWKSHSTLLVKKCESLLMGLTAFGTFTCRLRTQTDQDESVTEGRRDFILAHGDSGPMGSYKYRRLLIASSIIQCPRFNSVGRKENKIRR